MESILASPEAAPQIESFLIRLDRVRQVGRGKWMARCPAHADHAPSLSIRVVEDGRILLHDFGGCSSAAIVDAVGLSVRDSVRRRESLLSVLGGRLMRHLESDQLARLFHATCDQIRCAEQEVRP